MIERLLCGHAGAEHKGCTESKMLKASALMGFPGGSVVKNLPANAGDTGDAGLIPGLERSLEEEMAIHSDIPAWKSHGQKSVVGYSP